MIVVVHSSTSSRVAALPPADERRHVVENQQLAGRLCVVASQGGCDGGQLQFAASARHRDLLNRRFGRRPAARRQQRAERVKILAVEHGCDQLADDCSIQAQQTRCGAVDRRHRAGRIDRDDAGGDPLENRLDVVAPVFSFN